MTQPAPAAPCSNSAAPPGEAADPGFHELQLALYGASVLKQAKWHELSAAIGMTDGLEALDLGSDNGVISWLLRRRGGRWTSADLTAETVDAIRAMVGERVHRLTDATLPFPTASFDLIVVVDLLEHLRDDGRLLAEIARCLRPGGRAVLSIPHLKPWAVLPLVRHAIGLTDEWHGHLHPGYTRESLQSLLPPDLRIVGTRTYSRLFSHLLATALNWVYLRKSHGRVASTAKGMVVTGRQIDGGSLRTLRLVYPAMRSFVALDGLVGWTRGYSLLVRLEKAPSGTTP